MENLLFFLIGGLLSYIFTKLPIQITVHHKYENIKPPVSDLDMEKMEEQMLKDDPKKDDLYEKFEETLADVNNIMGGSDR